MARYDMHFRFAQCSPETPVLAIARIGLLVPCGYSGLRSSIKTFQVLKTWKVFGTALTQAVLIIFK
jgi:hypothetical protein